MRNLRWVALPVVALLGFAAWWMLHAGSAADTGPARAPERQPVPVEAAVA